MVRCRPGCSARTAAARRTTASPAPGGRPTRDTPSSSACRGRWWARACPLRWSTSTPPRRGRSAAGSSPAARRHRASSPWCSRRHRRWATCWPDSPARGRSSGWSTPESTRSPTPARWPREAAGPGPEGAGWLLDRLNRLARAVVGGPRAEGATADAHEVDRRSPASRQPTAARPRDHSHRGALGRATRSVWRGGCAPRFSPGRRRPTSSAVRGRAFEKILGGDPGRRPAWPRRTPRLRHPALGPRPPAPRRRGAPRRGHARAARRSFPRPPPPTRSATSPGRSGPWPGDSGSRPRTWSRSAAGSPTRCGRQWGSCAPPSTTSAWPPCPTGPASTSTGPRTA